MFLNSHHEIGGYFDSILFGIKLNFILNLLGNNG